AVHVGERAAENDEIGAISREKVERLGPGGGLDHREAGVGEQGALEQSFGVLGLDDEDTGRISHDVLLNPGRSNRMQGVKGIRGRVCAISTPGRPWLCRY